MAHAIQIGPRRFYEPARDLAYTLTPTAKTFEVASEDDRRAAEHLTWWHSPAAIAYRTGARFEHSTGLVSRWSLVTSTQGRYWIALEVWADADTAVSSKQTLPRHLHPSLYEAQLDGRAVECMRRAA